MNRKNVEINEENVEEIEKYDNYEILSKEQILVGVLDCVSSLGRGGSQKSRNY